MAEALRVGGFSSAHASRGSRQAGAWRRSGRHPPCASGFYVSRILWNTCCFQTALAKTRRLPLLFKGEDFSRTDIVPPLQANH